MYLLLISKEEVRIPTKLASCLVRSPHVSYSTLSEIRIKQKH